MKKVWIAIACLWALTACSTYNQLYILSNVSTIDDVETDKFKQGVKND